MLLLATNWNKLKLKHYDYYGNKYKVNMNLNYNKVE